MKKLLLAISALSAALFSTAANADISVSVLLTQYMLMQTETLKVTLVVQSHLHYQLQLTVV